MAKPFVYKQSISGNRKGISTKRWQNGVRARPVQTWIWVGSPPLSRGVLRRTSGVGKWSYGLHYSNGSAGGIEQRLAQLKPFSASNELSCLWTNRSPDDFISFCPYWPLLGNEFHPPILLAINFDYCRNYSTYENILLLKPLLNVEGYAKNLLLI